MDIVKQIKDRHSELNCIAKQLQKDYQENYNHTYFNLLDCLFELSIQPNIEYIKINNSNSIFIWAKIFGEENEIYIDSKDIRFKDYDSNLLMKIENLEEIMHMLGDNDNKFKISKTNIDIEIYFSKGEMVINNKETSATFCPETYQLYLSHRDLIILKNNLQKTKNKNIIKI